MAEFEKMKIWDSVSQPPPDALKPITGGRLKNMTAISPQWRYKAATEIFGPCGIGWKYTIDRLWLDPSGIEIIANASISLYFKHDGEWSEPIPGIGGSKLLAQEKAGAYNCDEAYKMAVTDALSVALKMLGFGADVYMGSWDGSKYLISIPTDDNKVNDWLAACESAADEDIDYFRKWWGENEPAIRENCGDAGAAQVYSRYVSLGKKKVAK